MNNIVVIGAGMVGSAMAADLASSHRVLLADIDPGKLLKEQRLTPGLETGRLDVTDKQSLRKIIAPFDLVVLAVPGFLGFEALQTIIDAGKNVVDISFFPEDPFLLDDLAQSKDVIAVVDCGVAPGLDNMMLGYWNERTVVKKFECLVGGLPKERQWPFNYKAPFSPVDVIEEYTRPARYVEGGRVVTRNPLTDVELIDFPGIGTLEAFNSDGLRTLIRTMPHIPDMKEKTLRYPGHAEYISVLAKAGFFGKEPVKAGGNEVKPIELTAALLFDEWKLREGEEEFTVMKVIVEGEKHRIAYTLYDKFDKTTGRSSMSRTTGYTATATANLILSGRYANRGINAPEMIGSASGCFEFVLDYLSQRNIEISISEEKK